MHMCASDASANLSYALSRLYTDLESIMLSSVFPSRQRFSNELPFEPRHEKKTVFEVPDQVRYKPGCTAIKDN